MSTKKKLHKSSATQEPNPEWLRMGNRLRECLDDAGMSQAALSRVPGLFGKSYINAMIQGKRKLSESAAEVIAPHLNVDPRYLLCETDYKNEKERTEDSGFQKHLLNRAEGFLSMSGFTLVGDPSENEPLYLRVMSFNGRTASYSYYSVSNKDMVDTLDRIQLLARTEMQWLLRHSAKRLNPEESAVVSEAIIAKEITERKAEEKAMQERAMDEALNALAKYTEQNKKDPHET